MYVSRPHDNAARRFTIPNICGEVRKLLSVKDSFSWENRQAIGIAGPAFDRVVDSGVEPMLFFAHPRVLFEQPRLLLYYRSLARVSREGLQRLVPIRVADIEQGKLATLDGFTQTRLASALNRLLSIIALLRPVARRSEGLDLLFPNAEAGAQIQGSWNNAIGKEGQAAVQEVLVRQLAGELLQVVWRDDTATDISGVLPGEVMARVAEIKVLRLRHGFHCVFGAEPDVSLRDSKDVPLLSTEIKAGLDPNGALERYGAAKKSFDHERGLNPRLKTVYVASCITPEVSRRLTQENPFSHTFLLGEILADTATQKRFANLFVTEIQRVPDRRASPK